MSALEELKKATQSPPPGARARVWQGMQAPAQRRSAIWVAIPAMACAAALAFVLLRQAPTPSTWTMADATVTAPPGSKIVRAPSGAFALQRGSVVASTWGQRLEFTAGSRRVEATAALFSVQVAGDQVTVDVQQGLVHVDGAAVAAGRRWPEGKASPLPLEIPETQEIAERREQRLATDAVTEGRFEDAIGWYQQLESRGTLRAEVAMIERGSIELRQLKDPSRALKTFDAAAKRFPNGSLSQERELSALDALVASKSWAAAVERADSFLKTFPTSERREEVEILRAGCASHER